MDQDIRQQNNHQSGQRELGRLYFVNKEDITPFVEAANKHDTVTGLWNTITARTFEQGQEMWEIEKDFEHEKCFFKLI